MAGDDQNKKKRTKRQHILPRSYLARFADQEQVWVHNFKKRNSYINNINDATCIDDFYTVKTKDEQEDDLIETELLARIEGLGNPIIDKMINEMYVPRGREKALFANYLAIMYARGIWFRQILQEVHEHFANDVLEQLVTNEDLFRKTMEDLKNKTGIDYDLTFEQAKEVYDNSETSVKMARTYYVKQMILYAAPLVNIFYKMNFNLIYAIPISNNNFITSDKPIGPVTNGPQGKYKTWLEDPEAVLYFPLSSMTCLMMDFKEEPKILSGKRTNVASINGVIANECVYISISKEPNFIWMRKNMTISNSLVELFDLFSEDKKSQPRVSGMLGSKLKTKCRSDVNLLKGTDD